MNDVEQPGYGSFEATTPTRPKIGRTRRAHRLFMLSWKLIISDRRLLLFPLISVLGGLVVGAAAMATFLAVTQASESMFVVVMIAVSAPMTVVTVASGVGTVSMVSDFLDGRDPSAGRAWSLIKSRMPQILMWSVFVWAIGSVLKALEERLPFAGRLVALVADIGFAFATMFAIPVLAYEGLSPRATLTRSTGLFRSQFAELMIGTIAIGCSTLLIVLPGLVFLALALATIASPLSVLFFALFVGWMIAAIALNTSLDFVYRTVLYRAAEGKDVSRSGWSDGDLRLAFKPKNALLD